MHNMIHEAASMAWVLHHGQTRADGGPYVEHPMRVAGLVSIHGDDDVDTSSSNDMIAAAWLHDIYEDTDLESPALLCISSTVERLVDELTNRFTKEAHPRMNRAERKRAEFDRLADCSPEAQIIKLCDRIDNLSTIKAKEGKKFHALYCDETDYLLEVISIAPYLHVKLWGMIAEIRKEL